MATAGGHNASPPKAPQGCPSAISAGGDLVGRVPGGAAPPRVTEGLVCADWAPPARRRGQCGGGLPYAKTGGVGGGGARLNRCGCGCVEKDTWSRPPLSLPCRAPTFPVLGTARALRLRGPLEVERAPARHCPPRSVPRGGCTSAHNQNSIAVLVGHEKLPRFGLRFRAGTPHSTTTATTVCASWLGARD